MSTRVRYANQNGKFVSLKSYTTQTGSDVKVSLDPTTLTVSVTDTNDGSIVSTVSGSSLVALKYKAKQALKDLGVSFGSETRSR